MCNLGITLNYNGNIVCGRERKLYDVGEREIFLVELCLADFNWILLMVYESNFPEFML